MIVLYADRWPNDCVTKPKAIASTHAQLRPRNIIHARALGAGRGREFEGKRYLYLA